MYGKSDRELDILDLLFTPLPQFLLQLRVNCVLIRKRDPSPASEILFKRIGYYTEVGTWWAKMEVEIPTLPLSSPAAGAVPAYKELIAPYVTEYDTSRPRRWTSRPLA